MTHGPGLRVVIVNFNGGQLLRRAVDSAIIARWPGPRQVVVVDNASTDGSTDSIEGLDGVAVIRNERNLGFGANNLALADLLGDSAPIELGPCDHVLLLNPDAELHPDALVELAAALDADPHVGAAAPHIVFDRPFVDLTVEDGAVRIRSITTGDRDVSRAVVPMGRAHRLPGPNGPLWLARDGDILRVPHETGQITLDVEAPDQATIAGQAITGRGPVVVDGDRLEHRRLVQNAGTELAGDGTGHNRGFGDVDGERTYAGPPDAWCGAAVLVRADYIRTVGGFEDSFFLYYEDVDLSFRGRALGWHIGYVPTARVEHRHSDATAQGTELVEVLQHRNRLLVLARNAPVVTTVAAFGRAALTPLSLVASAVRHPATAGSRLRLARWRTKALVSALRSLGAAVRSRRRLRPEPPTSSAPRPPSSPGGGRSG